MTTTIERLEAAANRARVKSARQAWRLHRKVCRKCAQLSKDRSQYCDDGWAMRVELHYAERANQDTKGTELEGQQALF